MADQIHISDQRWNFAIFIRFLVNKNDVLYATSNYKTPKENQSKKKVETFLHPHWVQDFNRFRWLTCPWEKPKNQDFLSWVEHVVCAHSKPKYWMLIRIWHWSQMFLNIFLRVVSNLARLIYFFSKNRVDCKYRLLQLRIGSPVYDRFLVHQQFACW